MAVIRGIDVNGTAYELRDQSAIGSGAHNRGAITGILLDGADLHLTKAQAVELRDFLTNAIGSAHDNEETEANRKR
jgi:hypothetical protein